MNIAEIINACENRTEIIVTVATTPKLLKKSRVTKEPCRFSSVEKVSDFALNLADKYIPTEKVEGEETKERKPWYKPTKFSWLKESLDGSKFYISAHCLTAKTKLFGDGTELDASTTKYLRDEFLPTHKKDENGNHGYMWLTISAENIVKIA